MTTKTARFVSRITANTLALVLAGGRGVRLKMLTEWRAKPAVPFGGKFRIIDFALSNCVNSSIRKVFVLTQYKSHSLMRHVLRGWNLFHGERGEFIELIPAQQWTAEDTWYLGTADAVYQSLDIINAQQPEYVLILAGDHIYKMDYGELLAEHVATGADFTVGSYSVAIEDAHEFGVMTLDENNRVTGFTEKPEKPILQPHCNHLAMVSMGIYVFSMDYLRKHLTRDAGDPASSHDFGKDIIPFAIENGHNVRAYPLNHSGIGNDYWRDVGTLDAYYQSNMELLSPDSELQIYDQEWRIWTYQAQLPPAKFIGSAGGVTIGNTMISGGCVISTSCIENSLLSSNVQVRKNCNLDEVLVLPDCEIGSNVRMKRVILDNGCVVPEATVIGENPEVDEERFYRTEQGVVVVTREMLGQERRYLPVGSVQHGS